MVAPRVSLTVTGGGHSGKKFIFSERARCVAGRAEDCPVRLTGAVEDSRVSRHHCLLEVAPPAIRVWDLGSRNGTFVNGRRIGQRPPWRRAGEAAVAAAPGYELNDGDVLSLGPVVFRVSIAAPVEQEGETPADPEGPSC